MLYRTYTTRKLSLNEIKSLLDYFNCDYNQTLTLKQFIESLNYDKNNIDPTTLKNLSMLENIQYTDNILLDQSICYIKWN